MTKYFRYSLAALFFAASVGCLGLRAWSENHEYELISPIPANTPMVIVWRAHNFYLKVGRQDAKQAQWELSSHPISSINVMSFPPFTKTFRYHRQQYHFPLWYPALVSALAGVAALRLGRRFTIRSAIIATTIVAVMLGMAVIL